MYNLACTKILQTKTTMALLLHIIDYSIDFIFKLQELNKCKIELQYWRSKSTTLLALPSTINPTCASCSAPLLPEGGLQSAENAEAELKNLANKGN